MRRNKLTILIFTIIMTCLMAGLGALTALNQYHYSEEGSSEYVLKTQEDFLNLVKHHEAIKFVTLGCNITISEEFESIGTRNKPFNSIFDGRGFTLTFEKDALKNSIFGFTSKNSKIMNVEIKRNDSSTSKSSNSFLVINNNGLITNINIHHTRLEITQDIMFGGLCALNYGTVSYSYVDFEINNNIISSDHRKESIIGGAVGFNEGVIDSVLTRITFTNFKETNPTEILAGNVINNTIGMLFGVNNGEIKNLKNNYIIPFYNYYLSDSKFTNNLLIEDFKFSEDVLLNKFHFNNKIWKLVVISEENYEYIISLMDGVTL